MEELPFDLPDSCDPSRTCLRRLHDIERTEKSGNVTYEGRYVNDRGQSFAVAATAHSDNEASLSEFVSRLRVCFEAIPEGERFQELEEGEGIEREEWDADISVQMELLRAPDLEAESVVCGFFVDPPIDDGEVHVWAPKRSTTYRVQMHVCRGRARVRVLRTGGVDEEDAAGQDNDTRWLAAEDSRVRVRGLQNGSSYYLRGGWQQPS